MSKNSDQRDIWIFAEQQNGKLLNVALELLGEGSRLSKETEDKRKVCAVLIGSEVRQLADELIEYGAEKVFLIEKDYLGHYTEDGYSKIMCDLITEHRPEIILFGSTRMGNNLASRIASEMNIGLVTNCIKLDINTYNYLDYLKSSGNIDLKNVDISSASDLLKQTRPGEKGFMNTWISPDTKPQLATVNPGVMDKNKATKVARGTVIDIEPAITEKDIKVKLLNIVEKTNSMAALIGAEIVCAGGRGLGDASGLELMEEFAKKVGGAVGASRFVVDSGWTDLSHQVGQSGTYVKPKIYFACGISGAIQHLVGMQDSDLIVAINKNPDAPIMHIADYAICGDLYKVIPEIISIWDDFR